MGYMDFTHGVLFGIKTVNVTFPFGLGSYTMNGKLITIFHTGLDMTPVAKVIAYQKGLVKEVSYNRVVGNQIFLQHNNGAVSIYRHLADGSITVKVGDIVEKGAIIATVGATGEVTGAHLHFEIQINGTSVDPLEYLQGKKDITPYEVIIMIRPEMPMLEILVDQLYYRDAPNGNKYPKFLPKGSYVYTGHSQSIGGYEWAEIFYEDKLVYCGMNPAWNRVVMPIKPPVLIPFSVSGEKDGQAFTVTLVPLVK